MKAMLLQWFERFDDLSKRERATIGGAILFGILIVGYMTLVDPQLAKQTKQNKQITKIKTDLATLETQITTLQAQRTDPDASNRAALQDVRKTMAAIDVRLRNVQDSLVMPEKMQEYLQGLLARNRNLELLSLRTLPVAPLINKPLPEKVGTNTSGSRATAASTPSNDLATNIYKHTLELQVAGSYADLLTYLEAIESMPQRTVWAKAELVVEQYPRCVLTLTVYTLSLDKLWLVV